MMRVEFRDDFKGDDALVIMAGAQDVQALSMALHHWSKCPNEVRVSSIVPEYSGVEIFLLRGGLKGNAAAYDVPSGVAWEMGEDAADHLGGVIGELSKHPSPAHVYLDFEGYARVVVISKDEY